MISGGFASFSFGFSFEVVMICVIVVPAITPPDFGELADPTD